MTLLLLTARWPAQSSRAAKNPLFAEEENDTVVVNHQASATTNTPTRLPAKPVSHHTANNIDAPPTSTHTRKKEQEEENTKPNKITPLNPCPL